MAETISNSTTTNRNEPDIEQSDRQGEARQAQKMAEHGAFEMKAVFLEITEHFFDPHSQGVEI